MHAWQKTVGGVLMASLVSISLASGGGGGGGGGGSGGGSSLGQPSVYTLIYRARQNIDKAHWAEAGDLLQQAYKLDAQNAEVLNIMGYYTRKKPDGSAQQALEYYEKALQIDPQHRGVHEYMGEAYLMLKQPEKAQEHLLALERICNKRCEEYKDLAQALAKYGN